MPRERFGRLCDVSPQWCDSNAWSLLCIPLRELNCILFQYTNTGVYLVFFCFVHLPSHLVLAVSWCRPYVAQYVLSSKYIPILRRKVARVQPLRDPPNGGVGAKSSTECHGNSAEYFHLKLSTHLRVFRDRMPRDPVSSSAGKKCQAFLFLGRQTG